MPPGASRNAQRSFLHATKGACTWSTALAVDRLFGSAEKPRRYYLDKAQAMDASPELEWKLGFMVFVFFQNGIPFVRPA